MAALGAIGGAVLTGSVSYISQAHLQRDLEQQKETFQRELADANSRADVAKITAQLEAARTEAARIRLEEHFKAVNEKKEQLKDQYWQIQIVNRVGIPIQAAVSSTALDGRGNVSGWYVIQNWSSQIVASTREPDLYVHVESPYSKTNCNWYPSTAVPIQLPVARDAWTQLIGDVFIGPMRSYESFYPYHILPGWRVVDLYIQCR
jgi:hypothetical protein